MTDLQTHTHISIYIYMRALEIVVGSASLGQVAEEVGYVVVSLDNDLPLDIQRDTLAWVN